MLFPHPNRWAAASWQRRGLCSSCPAEELVLGSISQLPCVTMSQGSLTQISHRPFLPNTPKKIQKDSLLESGAC